MLFHDIVEADNQHQSNHHLSGRIFRENRDQKKWKNPQLPAINHHRATPSRLPLSVTSVPRADHEIFLFRFRLACSRTITPGRRDSGAAGMGNKQLAQF